MEACSRSQNSLYHLLFVLNNLAKTSVFQGFRRILTYTELVHGYPTFITFGGLKGDFFVYDIFLVPHFPITDQRKDRLQ